MTHLLRISGQVIPAVVIAVVITVTQTVSKGSTYVDPGATARDNVDGDITSRIVTTVVKAVNTSRRGNTGEYWYDVKDGSGNAAERVVRKVMVR